MRRWRSAAALAGVIGAACVSLDPSGPHAAAIVGTYATTITIAFTNTRETRTDTVFATVVLYDAEYRGQFYGSYRAGADSGRVAGILRPRDDVIVTEFGPPPKQLAGVATLRALYAWCDWDLLGTGGLSGVRRGDTLRLSGTGSLPCDYAGPLAVTGLRSDLDVRVTAVRP